MGTISRDFSYRDFEKSETADRYAICNVVTTPEVRDSIKALVLDVLQPLQDAYPHRLAVSSGYRCFRLNQMVRGSETSQHILGEAADILCDNPHELASLANAMHLPFDQMILYPTFVHFSHKLHGEQRRSILYNKNYHGAKVLSN